LRAVVDTNALVYYIFEDQRNRDVLSRLKSGASSFSFTLGFIRRRPSRFAGSTPFRREVPAFGLPSRRCVPASSAGSGASLLPHPMDLFNPWAICSEHGAPSSGTSQEGGHHRYLSFSPIHPLTEVRGFLGTLFIKGVSCFT